MKKVYHGILGLALVLSWSIHASAAIVYSTSASYSHTIGTTTTVVSDENSSATLPVDAEVTTTNGSTVDWSGDAYARAEFNGLGFSRVTADGMMWHPEADDSAANPDILSATATMTYTYTNNASVAEALSYDFFLGQLQLYISDYSGGAPDAQISYSMDITGNGSSIWNSSTVLEGGKGSHDLLKTGTDLGGTYFLASAYGNEFGYNFDSYSNVFDLGTLAPGESYELIASLTASVTTAPFEMGGRAGFLDPGDFGFGGTVTVAPVPVPGAVWLLGSGLVGLVGFRRKRQG